MLNNSMKRKFAMLINFDYFNDEDLIIMREWKVFEATQIPHSVLLKGAKLIFSSCNYSFLLLLLEIFSRIWYDFTWNKKLSHCSYEFTAIPPVSHFFSINIIKFFISLLLSLYFCLSKIFSYKHFVLSTKNRIFMTLLRRRKKIKKILSNKLFVTRNLYL